MLTDIKILFNLSLQLTSLWARDCFFSLAIPLFMIMVPIESAQKKNSLNLHSNSYHMVSLNIITYIMGHFSRAIYRLLLLQLSHYHLFSLQMRDYIELVHSIGIISWDPYYVACSVGCQCSGTLV